MFLITIFSGLISGVIFAHIGNYYHWSYFKIIIIAIIISTVFDIIIWFIYLMSSNTEATLIDEKNSIKMIDTNSNIKLTAEQKEFNKNIALGGAALMLAFAVKLKEEQQLNTMWRQ